MLRAGLSVGTPPSRLHTAKSPPQGLTPPHQDGPQVACAEAQGTMRRFWLLESLQRSLPGRGIACLVTVSGPLPRGLSRKGKCGQAGARCSGVGGKPVAEERLSPAAPEPQHSAHCSLLSSSHLDTLAAQDSTAMDWWRDNFWIILAVTIIIVSMGLGVIMYCVCRQLVRQGKKLKIAKPVKQNQREEEKMYENVTNQSSVQLPPLPPRGLLSSEHAAPQETPRQQTAT
ncbi:PREDICTED: SLP adapter and CSK-interacting membrane protein [Ceratotherium simum simum]|uniref:SLP adapter and CSK-interacting membrane protein n=1 Tax=Ceratotherium simum simum TaxID=73337 RepID=A0ABM1D0F7_CERSS|nr:PREDICTED: SLP adapter and CSK-interacting membrane protein [Ceratotherium simum simum]